MSSRPRSSHLRGCFSCLNRRTFAWTMAKEDAEKKNKNQRISEDKEEEDDDEGEEEDDT